jgi:hypothetical protein
LLEIKSVVVHFQGKVFNPEWKTTGYLFVYQLADVGGGPTDKGIYNGRGKMRRWVIAM